MARGFQGASSLSVHRAFVVHFGMGGGPRRRRFHGRVEHLSSGRSAQFSSLEGLLAFVGLILDGYGPAAPRSPIDPERTKTSKPAGTPSSKARAGRTAVDGGPR
jgi:hypothetical protein